MTPPGWLRRRSSAPSSWTSREGSPPSRETEATLGRPRSRGDRGLVFCMPGTSCLLSVLWAEIRLPGKHDLCDNARKVSLGQDPRPVCTVMPE